MGDAHRPLSAPSPLSLVALASLARLARYRDVDQLSIV